MDGHHPTKDLALTLASFDATWHPKPCFRA
jgi:hypothetical protein